MPQVNIWLLCPELMPTRANYKVTLMRKTWSYHCQSMLLLPADLQWSGYGRACSWGTISPWLMGYSIRRCPYCILEVKVASLGGRSMSPKFLGKLKVNVILLPQHSSQFRIHHKGRQELTQAHRGNPWAFLCWKKRMCLKCLLEPVVTVSRTEPGVTFFFIPNRTKIQ